MNNPNYIIAVEIGSSKIKGAIGQVDPSGSLLVSGIEEARPNPNSVRYGCVQNVKEVANELRDVVNRLSARIPNSSIEAVYVGIGGRSLKATPARLGMQMPDVTEVTPEIVSDLLSRARNSDAETELLDVEPIEFTVDGKSQGTDPVGILGRDIAAKVNLVSCRSQILRNLQMAITDKLNIRINNYVVRPMALADLVLTNDEKRLGAMMVDCGAETTTVAIYKGGVLVYLATIPLGSRHITRDLTTLPLLEERAEEIKRTIGNASPDAADHRAGGIEEIDTSAINNIVAARASEIVANINAQIGYAGLTIADLPRGIVLTGGGSMLQGFAEQLNAVSGLPVRRGTLPPSIRVQGGKISAGEDLDVISLLYRLSKETHLRPCVKIAEPEPEPEVPENKPIDEADDEDWQIENEKKKKKNGGFSIRSLWENVKNGMQTPSSIDEQYGDDDEDDFTS